MHTEFEAQKRFRCCECQSDGLALMSNGLAFSKGTSPTKEAAEQANPCKMYPSGFEQSEFRADCLMFIACKITFLDSEFHQKTRREGTLKR